MASSSKWAPYMLVCLLFKISEDNDDEHDHCSTKMNITTNKGQELWKSQDVEDFVPVYQDTTNPASQFRILLANTGFAIRSASSFPQDLILNSYLKEMWGRSVHFHFPEPKRTSFSAEVFSFFDTPIDIKPYQFLWVNYFFTQGCQSLPGKDSPGTLIF